MSVADMKRYAALPSLDGARGQLLSILSAPAQKLSQNMTSHQVYGLKIYRYIDAMNQLTSLPYKFVLYFYYHFCEELIIYATIKEYFVL